MGLIGRPFWILRYIRTQRMRGTAVSVSRIQTVVFLASIASEGEMTHERFHWLGFFRLAVSAYLQRSEPLFHPRFEHSEHDQTNDPSDAICWKRAACQAVCSEGLLKP
jgi:hypothetical protein